MELMGVVGPAATNPALAVGNPANIRLGKLGEMVMQELHGRYYETGYQKMLFSGANQAATATTAAFATTYTGFCLSNPIGSNVNLVINKVGFASIVAQTSPLAFGVMTGFSAGTAVIHTTPGVPSSSYVGVGPTGVGLLDTACTLPVAPTLRQLLGTIDTGATTVATVDSCMYDLEGSVILAPGAYAAIYTSSASVATSILASFSWEEIAVA